MNYFIECILWTDVHFSVLRERCLARASAHTFYSIINIYYFCPGEYFFSFRRISCQIPHSIPHTKFNNKINWTECAKEKLTLARTWRKRTREVQMMKFNKKNEGDCKSRARTVTTTLFSLPFYFYHSTTNNKQLLLFFPAQLFLLRFTYLKRTIFAKTKKGNAHNDTTGSGKRA